MKCFTLQQNQILEEKKKKSMVIYSVILTAGLVGCLANAEMYGGGDTSDMWMNKEGLGRLLLKYLK